MKKSNKNKKASIGTILLVLVLIIGLSLLLYPSFSNAWNQHTQTEAITGYVDNVANLSEDKYAEVWQEAVTYNQAIVSRFGGYVLSDEEYAEYEQLLSVSSNQIMGYIEIPKINVHLPIYHGTSDAVLQVGVGHIEWSSLPTGGENTHCVLSGHRGLPSATLFTDLDELVVGDTFILTVLNETLTYEVDQILIVEPYELNDLEIEEGKDLCTLVTCTPYGINSHRLLVRGHRVENAKTASNVKVSSDAVEVDPLVIACIIVGPILLLILLAVWIVDRFRNKNKK